MFSYGMLCQYVCLTVVCDIWYSGGCVQCNIQLTGSRDMCRLYLNVYRHIKGKIQRWLFVSAGLTIHKSYGILMVYLLTIPLYAIIPCWVLGYLNVYAQGQVHYPQPSSPGGRTHSHHARPQRHRFRPGEGSHAERAQGWQPWLGDHWGMIGSGLGGSWLRAGWWLRVGASWLRVGIKGWFREFG